jgi:hypothetical protein
MVKGLLPSVVWLLVLGLTLPLFLRPEAWSPPVRAAVGLTLMVSFYYFNTHWLVSKVFERGYAAGYVGLVVLPRVVRAPDARGGSREQQLAVRDRKRAPRPRQGRYAEPT